MRIIFDVDREAQICGSATPYRNMCGFQGADDMHMSLTVVLPSAVEGKPDDMLEFSGSGKHMIQMLRSALDSLGDVAQHLQKENGPKRMLPCPDCDPHTIYPNATHTADCAVTKHWESASREKPLDKPTIQ